MSESGEGSAMAILTTSTRAPKSLARADFIGRWRTYVPGTGRPEALVSCVGNGQVSVRAPFAPSALWPQNWRYAVSTSIDATGSALNASSSPRSPARSPRSSPSIGCPRAARPPLVGSRRGSSTAKVGVFRDDRKPAGLRVLPYGSIVCHREPCVAYVLGFGEELGEPSHKARREVLIEEQPQAAGTDNRRRSRSAANARQARISSEVRSGKSARICASDMPDARYSSTS